MAKGAVAEEFQDSENADDVEKRVDEADIEKLGTAGHEAEECEDEDRADADRVCSDEAIEGGRASDCAE